MYKRQILHGADLGGADLRGADLGEQWIIQGPVNCNHEQFFLQKLTGGVEPMIKAGCRYFSVPDAREHWQRTRGGTPRGMENLAIVDFLVWTARNRGLIAED